MDTIRPRIRDRDGDLLDRVDDVAEQEGHRMPRAWEEVVLAGLESIEEEDDD